MTDEEAKRRLIEIAEQLRSDALSGLYTTTELIDKAVDTGRYAALIGVELKFDPSRWPSHCQPAQYRN